MFFTVLSVGSSCPSGAVEVNSPLSCRQESRWRDEDESRKKCAGGRRVVAVTCLETQPVHFNRGQPYAIPKAIISLPSPRLPVLSKKRKKSIHQGKQVQRNGRSDGKKQFVSEELSEIVPVTSPVSDPPGLICSKPNQRKLCGSQSKPRSGYCRKRLVFETVGRDDGVC